jgi:hypothetical protein
MPDNKGIPCYLWFEAQVQPGVEPFIKIPQRINIIGEVIGVNPKFKESFLRKALNIYFLNGVIPLDDLNQHWIKTESFDTGLRPTLKVKIQAKDLLSAVINRDFAKQGTGLNIIRQADYVANSPTLYNQMGQQSATFASTNGVDKYGFLLKPFILSNTDVDWLVRCLRTWTPMLEKYYTQKKTFMVSVVGGPKVYTIFKPKNPGGDYYDGGRINIYLSKFESKPKCIKDFTRLLVHEYTHFLQYLFVKTNKSLVSSWAKSAPVSNPVKYYSRMWERDAYAVQFLWEFLSSHNLPLKALSNGKILKEHFTPDVFKAYLKTNSDIKYHLSRMPKQMRSKWLNGLIIAAQKFVNDMQVNVVESSVSANDYIMLKQYPLQYSSEQVKSSYTGNKLDDFTYMVNAEYYQYNNVQPADTKLPAIMSRVSLYVE